MVVHAGTWIGPQEFDERPIVVIRAGAARVKRVQAGLPIVRRLVRNGKPIHDAQIGLIPKERGGLGNDSGTSPGKQTYPATPRPTSTR